MAVTVDQPVPDFQAPATNGQTVELSALKGQQVVIYFYPKDNTPGCTTQGQDFAITSLNSRQSTLWCWAFPATA